MNDLSPRDRILNAAEKRARAGGYNGFSFRDLATDVGVKSSSVHYHFPTKADLAEALAKRYAERALERLGDPKTLKPREAIDRLVALFRESLTVNDQMCLCGLFGAERDMLPDAVTASVADYFRALLQYLETSFGDAWAGPNAVSLLARLEGALILARTMRDHGVFDAAIADIS